MQKDIKYMEMSNNELMKKWLTIFGKSVNEEII